MPEPILRQSVRWGEEYVSRALNAKLAGVLKPGIYRGFTLAPHGKRSVMIEHGGARSSVAIVERDDYSLTVIMDDGGYVELPAPGVWRICLEAFYAPTKQGYQRLVARETVESHHVVLGKAVLADENGPPIVTYDGRMDQEVLTHDNLDAIGDAFDCKVEDAICLLGERLSKALARANQVKLEVEAMLEEAAQAIGHAAIIEFAATLMLTTNRLTRLELLHLSDLPVFEAETLPPNEPENPEGPANPNNPENPENPEEPDNPENPENPTPPDNPQCSCCPVHGCCNGGGNVGGNAGGQAQGSSGFGVLPNVEAIQNAAPGLYFIPD